jgi:hypothetical protein
MLNFTWGCVDHVLALFGRVLVVAIDDKKGHIARVFVGRRKDFRKGVR